MSDIGATPTCDDVLTGQAPLPSDNECFDGSSAQKTISLILGWPSGVLAGIAALVALFFAATGRRGRLCFSSPAPRSCSARSASWSAASRDRRSCASPGVGRGGEYTRPTLAGRSRQPGDRPRIPDRGHRRGEDRRRARAPARPRRGARAGPGRSSPSQPPPGSSAGPDADALLARDPGALADRRPPLPARRRGRALVGEAGGARGRGARRRCRRTSPWSSSPASSRRSSGPRRRSPTRSRRPAGEVLTYAAPKPRELPGWLAAEAAPARLRARARRGAAARRADRRRRRRGSRPSSTGSRVWAEPGGGRSRAADLEAMVADTSEEVAWALSDAIVDRDPGAALAAAERLDRPGRGGDAADLPGGEAPARGERGARAARGGRAGRRRSSRRCRCIPYAAKLLMRRLRDRSSRRDARRDVRDRRPRVVDAGRLGLSRARRAHARRAPRRRRVSSGRGAGANRAPRAPSCGRRRCDAARPCRPRCRSASRARGARRRPPPSRRPRTAASSRLKWVLTALVRRRFSSCSRSGAGVALLL